MVGLLVSCMAEPQKQVASAQATVSARLHEGRVELDDEFEERASERASALNEQISANFISIAHNYGKFLK
jgi:hypothetical protein